MFLFNLNSFDYNVLSSFFSTDLFSFYNFGILNFFCSYFSSFPNLFLYKFFFLDIGFIFVIYILISLNTGSYKVWFWTVTFYFIYKNFKTFLKIVVNTQFVWYYSIWFIFSLFNLISLLPKIPALTSILIIPVFVSFWIFLVNNFKSLIILGNSWTNHFFPGKISHYIAPLLIFIEAVSYIIRPVSLSVRLFANILSGHILVHILSGYGSLFFNNKYLTLYLTMLVILIVLNFLEYFIGLVQSTVFILISVITQSDNNFFLLYFKEILKVFKKLQFPKKT